MTACDMRVYVDSSALIKRSVEEPESDALDATLAEHFDHGDVVVTSSLAWIEVSRALQSRLEELAITADEVNEAFDVALSGVAERQITTDVVSLARRLAPKVLRTLDAVHLATAILLDADTVITYDNRLGAACRTNALAVVAPGG
ncbi:type II toxin-antitoxin system VapC family toxin [Phytoactinopolyspora limicola]|uniref:type II toxin-antitoxin system VapC family toxin n=1 Tax=Phytoactinopolyspora limicola TaxID=2715536 RepID=UPI001A9CA91D|nr:type II toxin-antitoxin system VapC family toxin [Phytoactinopolyspora limicola]